MRIKKIVKMKPLKLANEHKKKLLEMCKALLPKLVQDGNLQFSCSDNNGEEDESPCLCYKTNQYGEIVSGESATWSGCGQIHWFEFCLLHLSDAMTEKAIKNADLIDFESLRHAIIANQYKHHPIDYLYIQFQSLKLK